MQMNRVLRDAAERALEKNNDLCGADKFFLRECVRAYDAKGGLAPDPELTPGQYARLTMLIQE